MHNTNASETWSPWCIVPDRSNPVHSVRQDSVLAVEIESMTG